MNNNDILKDYLSGSSLKTIQKKYGIGQQRIYNLLEEKKIKPFNNHERAILKRTDYKIPYEKIVERVLDNYNRKKMGQLASGKEFNLTAFQVSTILERNKIQKRDFAEAASIKNRKYRKYNNNPSYFETESSNMAYIMGFLASDGTIGKKTNRIKITLADKDYEILEKIQKEIPIEAPLKRTTTNSGYDIATLDWTCSEHKDSLKLYGIIPEKTFKLKPPYLLDKKYWIDYIRGFFDGDGSINLIQNSNGRGNGNLRWQVCSATKEILEFIINFFYEEFSIPKVSIMSQYRKNILYYFQYSSSATRKIYEILYTSNSLFLKRKKIHFEEVLQKVKPLSDIKSHETTLFSE